MHTRSLLLAALVASFPAAAQDLVVAVGADPFGADPAALARAVASVRPPADADDEILLLEHRYAFDADGGYRLRIREVVRVVTADGVAFNDVVGAVYEPWLGDRPVVQARVVTPDGRAHVLDPRVLTEAQEGEGEEDVFSDRRVIEGPLPAVKPGAVVETVSERVVRRPSFEAGKSLRVGSWAERPVRLRRIVVQAPKSLPLKTRMLGTAATPKREARGDVVVETWELRDLPPGVRDALAPDDDPGAPLLLISTARSWQDVAAAYAREIEPLVDVEAMKPIVRGVVGEERRPRAVLDALVDHVQQNVRYTGVEFGRAALVPRAPRETLATHYGDCKDTALLFVALARAAGFDADVALLRTAGDVDAHPEHPGLGAFDHAVAYVRVDGGLFVDLTVPYARVGTVPHGDRGRRALVVDAATTSLITTPVGDPTTERMIEERRVVLAPEGAARVEVKLEAAGLLGDALQSQWADGDDAAKRRDAFVKVAQEGLEADGIDDVRLTDVSSNDDVLRAAYVARGSRRGWTDAFRSVAVLDPHLVLGFFPSALEPQYDGEKPAAPARTRTVDWQQDLPYAATIVYRVAPPAGHRVDELPKDVRVAAAGHEASATTRRLPDGDVETTFRFVAARRRLTVAEADQVRAALATYAREAPKELVFPHEGAALLATGRVKEGFAAYGRLADADARSALRREQLSAALLKYGLGDEARIEARRAVAIAPKRGDAWWALAQALMRDRFGRERARGWDRDGAIDAFEKAAAFEPTNTAALVNAGFLAEHDVDGRRHGAGARYDRALAAYEKVLAAGGAEADGATEERIANALLRSGKAAEARDRIRRAPQNHFRQGLQIAAIAVADGIQAAQAAVSHVAPDAESARVVVVAAATIATEMRRYDLALPLFRTARDLGATLPAAGMVLLTAGRAERFDERAAATGPEGVVVVAHRAALTGDAATLKKLLASATRGDAAAAGLAGTDHEEQIALLAASGVTPTLVIDAILSQTSWSTEGSEQEGWRVVGKNALVPGDQSDVVYLVKEGTPKVLGSGARGLSPVGAHALRVSAGGGSGGGGGGGKAAARLVGWAIESLGPPSTDEDLLAGEDVVAFWTTADAASVDDVRVAAAMLCARDKCPEAVPVLRKAAAARAAGRDRSSFAVRSALAWALLSTDRFDEAKAVAAALARDAPSSPIARRTHLFALARSRDVAGDGIARALLAADPTDDAAVSYLARMAVHRGDVVEAARVWRAAVAAGERAHAVRNQAAWSALFAGVDLDLAVRDAEAVNKESGLRKSSYLHTLAALYAHVGRPADALNVLARSVDMRASGELRAYDWYVVGRVQEEYGLLDAARRSYAKVTKADPPEQLDTYELAQARLAHLK